MNFCSNCGAHVKDNQKVCTQCGTPIHQTSHKDRTEPKNINSYPQRRPHKSKLPWVITIAIVLALILLFITYKIVDNQLSVKKEGEAIAKDLKNGKISSLSQHLTCDGKHLSKEETQAFYDYIKETDNPTRVANEIESSAKTVHRDKLGSKAVTTSEHTLVDIQQNGKKLVIFKNYDFEVPKQPVSITPEDTGELHYKRNGNTEKVKLEKDKTKVLGDFPLGIYHLDATEKINGKNFKGELLIDMSHDNSATTNFKQKRFTVSIDSLYYDNDSLKLYINGKEQGKFSAYSDKEFGPYAPDDKVEVYATTTVEGKTFKSNTLNVPSPEKGEQVSKVKLAFNDDDIEDHSEREIDKKSKSDDTTSHTSEHSKVTRSNVIDKVESFEGKTLDTSKYTYKEPEKKGNTWGFSFTDKKGNLAGSYIIDADDGYVTKYDEDGKEIDSGY
ncbi:zinc-ribbon domain-containing protein [Staphylococcus sp. SQ8-PEA]|uniref:Zinc-ribbon domain-containing protein n=1 Tax=Staphylococcus marylandisciuri TaxID=2981529 RepID=A0ABT2QN78_9STAP|nr:zinc-ribbon domain-containing protein [Staphylococcus marylandisciuri]MCU5745415.1 zinc-ribbon domain-containing protein [Staphylococcus marylandisciuri]